MTSDDTHRTRLLAAVVEATVAAGFIVWDHFCRTSVVQYKSDSSPVTEADKAAEAVILAALRAVAPGIPVVAEEEAAQGHVPDVGGRFFLVDPLDGTKEFIKRGTDFTVNIGLIENGLPTMGAVYAPARGTLYWGDCVAKQAWRASQPPHAARGAAESISVRKPVEPPRAVASKSHNTPETEAWLADAGVKDRVSIGSSLKFVLVASGDADVYPRPAPTMEWDTAAGDAVLRAAGGRVFDPDGQPLVYGKEKFFNPGFIATGSYEPARLRPFMAVNIASGEVE
ncbi:MAG: 3'(2'),5'-bisphosphate nucleotidase CysQ [Steroidobacteraceae bacterium]